ncbi:MAG TPA: hypothetical protein VMV41_06175, partial [Cellulomonadaceae bacterium]|nr:hypothetical protein [Cellulomonadaceae bacterium]
MTLDIARRNRPWAANDPADAVPWDGPQTGDTTGGVLGDIAVPAVLVPGGCRTTEVDELFRRDGALRCVVLDTPDRPVLVDRAAFEAALTGRLGYGRLLHSRRAVVEMVTEETLVMPHDAPITVTVTEPRGSAVEHLVTIGASVGVAHADRSHPDGRLSSLDVLLKHADLAMYRAKEHGR